MTMFVIALATFILLHIGVSATPLRAAIVKAVGEGVYRGLFSLASGIVLAWMLFSFGAARADPANVLLWTPPDWARHVTATLVLAGFLLGVTGMITPNPVALGFASAIQKPDPAPGIIRVTRHPFLWGVALWGVGHAASNPEAASLLLFGGLAAMSLAGTRSIDRKAAARDPTHWARFKAVSSNVPFAAILQGRNSFNMGETAPRLLVALLAYAAVAYFHGVLFGVKAFAFGAG
ncbi:MAG: NnrU family protein [Hyphomonadaceae bacterium]|nr:NnrU family protein [Hyphomonadaceae bacterium]